MTRDEVLDAVYDEVTAKDTCVEDAVVSLLEEIVRLRGERDALRHEMHDRMNKLHRVLGDPYGHLTEEVARLSRILAALREPSEAVVKAVKECIYEELGIEYWDGKTRRIMYYAIEAAEKEASA